MIVDSFSMLLSLLSLIIFYIVYSYWIFFESYSSKINIEDVDIRTFLLNRFDYSLSSHILSSNKFSSIVYLDIS